MSIADLDAATRQRMLQIYATTFANTAQFEADLADKDSVVLLYGEEGLSGFSTLQVRQETLDRPSIVFFSGDTVVLPGYRDRFDLSRLWAGHVFRLVSQHALPCYWFLICSGFRTYRFLPTFFQRFFPRHDQPTPPQVQGWIDHLAMRHFGQLYDRNRGIVRLSSALLEELPARRLDAHSQFFLQKNPEWHKGHELACLTRLHRDNLTAAGKRMLGP